MKNIKSYKYYFFYLKNLLKGNFHPFLLNEIDSLVTQSFFQHPDLDSDYSLKKLYAFLKNKYGKDKEILITKSGRHALKILLKSLNLPKNSEIIIPSYSCLGLVEPIISSGFIPHFVDIKNDLNPSFQSIKSSINNNIKVCIFPYLGGSFSDDLFKIKDLCQKKKIILIEDCCQAFGLKYKEKDVGLFADASFFSSGVGKPIFTPEGGWLVVNNSKILKSDFPYLHRDNSLYFYKNNYKSFANKFSGKYLRLVFNVLSEGFNFILKKTINENLFNENRYRNTTISDLSASIILNEIDKIDVNIEKRKKNAQYWFNKLRGKNVEFHCHKNSIYNKLFIKVNDEQKKEISLSGYQLESGYKPLHLRYFFDKYPKQSLYKTIELWEDLFSLPTRPSLDII